MFTGAALSLAFEDIISKDKTGGYYVVASIIIYVIVTEVSGNALNILSVPYSYRFLSYLTLTNARMLHFQAWDDP